MKAKGRNIHSCDQYMDVAEQSPHVTALHLEAHSLVRWTDYFKSIYNLDGEDYKNLGVNESGYQFLVAGDDFDSIPDDQVEFAPGKTISLRSWMRRVSSGRKGVVRCWTQLPRMSDPPGFDDSGNFIDFPVYRSKHPAGNVPVPARRLECPAKQVFDVEDSNSLEEDGEGMVAVEIADQVAVGVAESASEEDAGRQEDDNQPTLDFPPSASEACPSDAPVALVTKEDLKGLRVGELKKELEDREGYLSEPVEKKKPQLIDQLHGVLEKGTYVHATTRKRLRIVCRIKRNEVIADGAMEDPQLVTRRTVRTCRTVRRKDWICFLPPLPFEMHPTSKPDRGKPSKPPRHMHTASQVETLGWNCINQASSLVYSSEIKASEHVLFPGGSVEGYLERLQEGSPPCRQLNNITRISSIRAKVSPLPRMAFVNAELKVPEHLIGEACIEHTGEPVFWVHPDRPCSIRASGALQVLESTFGGDANKEESPTIADLVAIVARQNGVDIASDKFRASITIDEDIHQALSSALKAHKEVCQSRKKQAAVARPAVPNALAFFKKSDKYNDSTLAPSPKDQYEALDAKDKKPFQNLAALARYKRYIQNIEDKLTENISAEVSLED